jgi:hypothetical protein
MPSILNGTSGYADFGRAEEKRTEYYVKMMLGENQGRMETQFLEISGRLR